MKAFIIIKSKARCEVCDRKIGIHSNYYLYRHKNLKTGQWCTGVIYSVLLSNQTNNSTD